MNADDRAVPNEPELDDAIKLAAKRTQSAQREVDDVIAADEAPPVPMAERVVERADDLKQLADDASDSERS